MTTRNPFDAANLSILGEIKEYRDRARKAKPITQGTEKLTAEQTRAKLATMSPAQRQAMVEKIGMPKILEILGE